MLILKFSGAKVEFDCSTDKNKKNLFIVVSRNEKKFD